MFLINLAKRVGAPYCLHKKVRAFVKFDCVTLVDGQMVDLGNVKIKVLHTPGHTLDSLGIKRLNLPVDLEIFPGHQAGSACGVGLSRAPGQHGQDRRFQRRGLI